MAVDPKVEQALRDAAPLEQLRGLARNLQDEGRETAWILEVLDKNREALREAGRESEEDVVLEVMDSLVGWCSPHMSMAPKNP